MKNNLRMNKYVVYSKEGSVVILWNRMIGGCVTVTFEQFNALSGANIDEEIISVEKVNELKKANILIGKTENELKNLAKQSKDFVVDAINCMKLRCLELSVSEHCNYQCIYCTFWRNKSTIKKKYMSTEVAEKALKDFLNVTCKQKEVVVYFGTAEPLMNWEVIAHISRLAKKLRSDVSLNLITNGSLMTEERLRFCKENKINVGISFDGLPNRQNKQRIPSSGDVNSSEAVLKLLELGNKINFTFSCLSATYSQTGFKPDIEYLVSICQKYGVQEFDLDFDVNHLGKVNTKIIKDELLFGYQKIKDAGLNIFGYWLIALCLTLVFFTIFYISFFILGRKIHFRLCLPFLILSLISLFILIMGVAIKHRG